MWLWLVVGRVVWAVVGRVVEEDEGASKQKK